MARNDAVSAVTGEIFREGWSKVRGSMQGLGQKRPQMVRVAKGHRSAVFKPVRSGGCQTKKELTNQLEYLTMKSSHIVDSRGVLDGKRQLNADEIKSVVDRFSGRWSEGFRPKMGHTTHMLMSYPKGTKPETRAQIETALRGTGISSSAIIARVEQGASNASLEQRWIADDLSKIAKEDGLNLERQEDLAVAAQKLDEAHVRLGEALEGADVLKDDGIVYSDDQERQSDEEFASMMENAADED